jgi:hypothetical protein
MSKMMIKRLLLLAVIAFLASSNAGAQSLKADSLPGRFIKRVTTPARFVSFDKKHNDRFFARDASDQMLLNEIMVVPEMDCFLANHAKDDLQISYEIHELTDSTAKTVRVNYATRIISLKTGDDSRTWAAKEASDSTIMQRHHEQLKREREE